MIKQRGRPKQFDADEALDNAIQVFWSKGLNATSLDDLAGAMNMNRPSIYNAFGDKQSLYRKALARFIEQLGQALDKTLFAEPDLKQAINLFYHGALEVYFGHPEPLGCFVTCTAPVEAVMHPEIKTDLNTVIKQIDTVIEQRLKTAQTVGDLAADKDIKQLSRLLHATLQSLAIRARAGESRATLKKMYSSVVDLLC